MMSYVPFVGLVLLCGLFSKVSAVGTNYGQNSGNYGFVVISATYADASCSRLDLATNVQYVPVGACIPTSSTSSVLYSTNDNTKVVLSQFSTNTCSGTQVTTDVTVDTTATTAQIITSGGVTGTVLRQTCVLQTGTSSTYISSYYITATAPVLAGSVMTTS